MNNPNYQWVLGDDYPEIADEYEVLLRPDGTEVTTITEPEDRIGYRDLAPIVDELNKQQQAARLLLALLRAFYTHHISGDLLFMYDENIPLHRILSPEDYAMLQAWMKENKPQLGSTE